jgi:glutaredoxin
MKKILIVLLVLSAAFVLLLTDTDRGPSKPGKNIQEPCGEECSVPSDIKFSGQRSGGPYADTIPGAVSGNTLTVSVFYSRLCPHCDEARKFFDALTGDGLAGYEESVRRYRSLADRSLTLAVKYHEMLDSGTNRELLERYSAACGVKPRRIPVIFIGDTVIEGFEAGSSPKRIIDTMLKLQGKSTDAADAKTYHFPVLGEVDAERVFLPAFTVALGLLDGLNPCAMWVLVFLLGILAYSRSKKRMLLVGVTFVTASGLVYFALMAAWLNLFMIMGVSRMVMVILAAAAIMMGLVNLKEILFFKKGLSLMIPESAKPGLYRRVRGIMKERNLVLALALTFILAVFVNIIELACTAGFPAIFTKILADRNEPVLLKYLYMALYNVMYVQPLLLIVVIFVLTMGHFRMKESQARILKLISGVLMLVLGLLLLFRPEMMIR